MKNSTSYFVKLRNLMIVTTFFSLWLASQLDESTENILAYVLILSFGIIHGANDIKLIKQSYESSNSYRITKKILLCYIVFVLFGALSFYIIPSIALLLFVLFSAYHFGEQHWNSLSSTHHPLLKITLFFSYGLFILTLLFYFNSSVVSEIIKNIATFNITSGFYYYSAMACGLISLFILLLLVLRDKLNCNRFIRELFYVLVFFVVFNSASLLWSFAIYFVFWHSLPSLADQVNFLYGDLSKTSVVNYFKSSFLYWFISIIGLALIIFIHQDDLETTLSFFFSVLAAITFPHVLVINQMNKF